ncbi:hypothetical protein DL98DRAFT_589367 [Cadophora sp. DSE1049]|nr:hypothetical protein DL98DRAFT_589367 [Cadophora sp. DSE1049]
MPFGKTLKDLAAAFGHGAKRHLSRTPNHLSKVTISNASFMELGQKTRESQNKFRSLTWADNETQKHAIIKTTSLCISVYRDFQNPDMASASIHALPEPEDRNVKDFVRKKGPEKGHKVMIGERIRFRVGDAFNVEAFVQAVANGGVDDGKAAEGPKRTEDKVRKGK